MITFLILLGIGVAGGYILNNVIPGKNPPTPPATSTQSCQTEHADEKVMLLEAQIKDKDVQIATLTSQLSDTFKTQQEAIIAAKMKINELTSELFNNSNDKLLIADLTEELEHLNKILLQHQRVVKQMHFLYLEAKQFDHSPEEIATWVEPLLLDLFELVSF